MSWPHEHILGGQNRQRLTYDQITMPQFVQGFVKNILDEQNEQNREHMLQYLGDIMEDASDFSWQSAKASHAVLLCEMERGKVTWQDTARIDRVRRAYVQKHQGSGRQNWGQKMGIKNPGSVSSTEVAHVHLKRTTRLGGSYIGTFVPLVWHKVGNLVTQNVTVTLQKRGQKTRKWLLIWRGGEWRQDCSNFTSTKCFQSN